MSRLELARGSKGLWQRVEALWRSMLPRQARVTRIEGNSVWVRFLGDGASGPEAKFVSTVSSVPVATMGWVLTLGGKKGLFVATGIQKPITPPIVFAAASLSASTAGDYFSDPHAITVTGLSPSKPYTVDWDMEIRTTSTASRGFSPRIRTSGESTIVGDGLTTTANRNNEVTSAMGRSVVTPDADGEIAITPGFRWSSGTVTANFIIFRITVS